MSIPRSDRERVTNDVAQQLLAQAATFDQDGLWLAELRSAAIEAGISGTAFDQAVHEWRAGTPSKQALGTWTQRVLRNAAAFGVGWTSLAILATADRLLAVPGVVHKLTDPIGLLVGIVVALRLQARTAAVVMGGLAVAEGAEYLMDLLAGAPTIHGFYAHIGLIVAGIGGVAVSLIRRSRDGRGPSSSVRSAELTHPGSGPKNTDDPDSGGVGLTNAEADKRFIELLRLRRNSHGIRLQLS
jgi:hypothetical protein